VLVQPADLWLDPPAGVILAGGALGLGLGFAIGRAWAALAAVLIPAGAALSECSSPRVSGDVVSTWCVSATAIEAWIVAAAVAAAILVGAAAAAARR
jgi:hypothetical protein